MDQPGLTPVQPAVRDEIQRRGIAIAGLLGGVVLLVGLAWVAPPPNRPVPAAAAPSAPTPTPIASDHPSESPALYSQAVDWTGTFTSERFGYTIGYPDGWIPVEAGEAAKPDRITAPPPSRTVLSIRRSPLPEGEAFLAFAEEHLRHRAQPDGCHWNGGGVIYIPTRFDKLHEITIDGHRAAYRSECGYVDAVVHDGDDFLGITLRSAKRKATGDLWWFERFAEHLDVSTDAGVSPPDEASTRFISEEHGYALRLPDGWITIAAVHPAMPDVVRAPLPEMTSASIHRGAISAGVDLLDFADEHLRHRVAGVGCQWKIGAVVLMPAERDSLHEIRIDGHPAAYRSECGYVDAVVQDGDEFLGITFRTGRRQTGGQAGEFVRFAENLEFHEDSESGASTGESTLFISALHGYTIRYPTAWHVSHARRDRDPDVLFDGLLRGDGYRSKLSIKRLELPSGLHVEDVAPAWFPTTTLKRGDCGSRQPMWGSIPRIATFKGTTIAGRASLVRSECSVVDAIVDLDGDALLLTLRSRKSTLKGDDKLFAALIETLEIDASR